MLDISGFTGPWPYWDIAHKTPEAILSLMDRYQIQTLGVCSTRSIFWDWRQGNEEAITLAKKYPARFLAFVSLSPILPAPDLVRLLHDYKRRQAKGLRLYPQHHGYSLTASSGAAKILKTAEEIALPVVLPFRAIMNWGLPELGRSDIEATVSRYPKGRFVLSGINYDTTLWAYDFMQRFPNTYLEISGLQGFRAVDDAVRALGAKRILFGSGLPLLYPACSVEKLKVSKLTPDQKHAVAEGNAHDLLGI
jgi:predicted TIM-barrel fold metal-dependent hydrolase